MILKGLSDYAEEKHDSATVTNPNPAGSNFNKDRA
jgi:hypothetical protein